MMPGIRFSEQDYRRLCELDEEANLNLFLSEMVKARDGVRPVWSELLRRARHIVENHGAFLSPDTLMALRSLPPEDRKKIGMKNLRAGMNAKRPAQEGSIYFPIVKTHGHVRQIRVFDGETLPMQRDRQLLLDAVGRTVVGALQDISTVRLHWNPLRYSFEIVNNCGEEDPLVTGDSMGLPLALALGSRVVQEPLPPDVSATAVVETGGSVRKVESESFEEKLRALSRECFFVRHVIVSRSQKIRRHEGLQLVRVDTVGEALSRVWRKSVQVAQLSSCVDVHAELNQLEIQYEAGLYESCRLSAEDILDSLREPSCPLTEDEMIPVRFTCYWRIGSCCWRQGDTPGAEKYLKKARALYLKHRGHGVFTDYLESMIQTAVVLKEMFRFGAAEELHRELDRLMRKAQMPDHLRGKNMGALGQLYLATGRAPLAEKTHRKAIELIRERSRSRSYGYLSQVCTRQGKFGLAEKALENAKEWLPTSEVSHFQKNLAYYNCFRAEFLCRRAAALGSAPKAVRREIDVIAAQHSSVDDYIPVLIHKYRGLVQLGEGDARGAMESFDKALAFFKNQNDPMDQTYKAGVLVERAILQLNEGRYDRAAMDFSVTVSCLSPNGDLRRYAGRELKAVSRLCAKRSGNTMASEAALTAACRLRDRLDIPFL